MITEVSKITGISEEDILGKSRKQRISDARHLYFFVLRENGFSISDIARLSERNHATVIWGINSFKNLLGSGNLSIKLWYSMSKKIKR